MRRYKIAIVTATRAEYGLLMPLIQKVFEDHELELDLIVTGGHLSEKQGRTIDEIHRNGFPIVHEIPILEDENSPYGVSLTMANAIKGFAECFRDDRPDMVVILGDRTEMLGVAAAAMNERIPIAHLYGGEITEGAVDDCVRHALSKISYLHFTSTEQYRQRVIQLGEAPGRVFNYGALGVENILTTDFMGEDELRYSTGIPTDMPYVVTTFHPVTLEDNTSEKQTEELCSAIADNKQFFYLITMSNADAGGDLQNNIFKEFAAENENVKLVGSLGMRRYLSAVKYAAFVLGNSSSGILEAPVLGTPTVNIGDWQKGRIMADTIINCGPQKDKICRAMEHAIAMEHRSTNIYGNGNTSQKIVETIKRFLKDKRINLKKGFYEGKLQ